MEKVDNLLEQAGYFEDRKVDISAILYMYEKCGYHCGAKQKHFMEKYAYLDIYYPHPIWKQKVLLRLNPIEAQKIITMDVVEEYNKFLRDKLLIIGDVEAENMTLFLSEKGVYFGGYDDCIITWGDNFEIMLSKLISGEKGKLQIIE